MAIQPANNIHSEKEVSQIFQTNVFGPLFLSQALLPAMRARKSGTIVNISSVAGQNAIPSCSLYASTKFALEGMTESLAKEVADFGISVLIVEPGAFRTNFLNAMVINETGLGDYQGNVVGETLQKFQAASGKQAGDPDKAVAAIYEIVVGQGEAGKLKGKVLRLVLGKDALARIEGKVAKFQEDMALSRDVTCSTDFS
jgi:NAD(P)-dependent dehydrogenase (short-subunit alcohol dehydrogenase family)